jgi:hypothetical protein
MGGSWRCPAWALPAVTGFSIGLFVFPAALLLAASAFLRDVSDS